MDEAYRMDRQCEQSQQYNVIALPFPYIWNMEYNQRQFEPSRIYKHMKKVLNEFSQFPLPYSWHNLQRKNHKDMYNSARKWLVEMVLHRDDATMLRSLLKDNFDLNVSRISGAITKILFSGPKFKFLTTESGIEQSDIKYLDSLKDYVTVDCSELLKLAAFAEEYSASKKIIGMSIKNSQLNVSIKNVLAAKHSSTVQSTSSGSVKDTSGEAEVPSHNLLKVLKLFQDKRSREVNIYISDEMLNNQNSIILFDSNTQAIINIYNR